MYQASQLIYNNEEFEPFKFIGSKMFLASRERSQITACSKKGKGGGGHSNSFFCFQSDVRGQKVEKSHNITFERSPSSDLKRVLKEHFVSKIISFSNLFLQNKKILTFSKNTNSRLFEKEKKRT